MRKLDVLFIEPNCAKESYQDLNETYSAIETPTWSLLLAQSCRSVGYGVSILDAAAERLTDELVLKRVKEIDPRLVVFVMYGQNPNSGTTSMIGAYRTGTKLKEDQPNIRICMVGSHVSSLPKEVLEHPAVDFVLLNEGVYALRNLLATDLKSGDQLCNVKGIGWKIVGVPCLNSPERIVPQERMDIDLPGYAWDLLPYDKKPFDLYRSHFWHAEFDHNKRTPFAAIYTSLGCPFGCSFCMINILNRMDNGDEISSENSKGIRYWGTDLITKQFEILSNAGVETVRLSDEMFFLKKGHFEPLLTNLVNQKMPLRMWAYSRIDTVQEKYLELFKKAGINWLALGIEAANQDIRLEVTKGSFKNINIRETVKLIQNADIQVMANYILGFPDDTYKTMGETVDLALELNTAMINFYPCQALPGSPIYFQAKKNGWELPANANEYAFLGYECKPLPTKHLTAPQVLKYRDEAWLKYFTNTAYLDKVEKLFGVQSRNNVVELAKIRLKRKLLGD
jgi:radical SAM superfamily enzyme YgiQ (UPF0313 family)